MRLDGADRPRVHWYEADERRLVEEQAAMRDVAPELVWTTSFPDGSPAAFLGAGGWQGRLPLWPFCRPAPKGVTEWLGRGMEVVIGCSPAHPVAMPRIWPLDPEPTVEHRTRHSWHLNGDGTVCFFLLTTGWTGRELVSELVYKASGWFLEYQLMNGDPDVDVMTSEGIASSNIFDQRLAALAVTECLPE
jgi:hypothetical protein